MWCAAARMRVPICADVQVCSVRGREEGGKVPQLFFRIGSTRQRASNNLPRINQRTPGTTGVTARLWGGAWEGLGTEQYTRRELAMAQLHWR
jgi:hypothetical protein